MITLKINGIEVTVPKGSTILEAAEKAGVFIPTLCHDNRIKPYGACRVCLVTDGRKPGNMIPACFTPARAGMDILTDTPAVVEAVKMQLQMILVNHPLDCPICDKAGECTLQDLVIRYDIKNASLTAEPVDRYIDRQSPLIERNMTRCILCGRCVRICGELQGCGELEFIHRGFKTTVGTDGGRPLDCDFCGLCVSTCPVGAINDKLYKDKTRFWNLNHQIIPCTHCGLGCLADYHLEKGRIRRITPAAGEKGEKGLLCVRGQFGWRAYESPTRLLSPQIRQDARLRKVEWSKAIGTTALELNRIRERYGASAIAMLTADHLTTEEAVIAGILFRDTLDCAHIGSLQAEGYRSICATLSADGRPSRTTGTFQDIDESDILLVLGGGAAELHPVLKPLVHNFLKHEGKELIVLSGWPDILSKRATLSLSIKPDHTDNFFAELRNALDGEELQCSANLTRSGVDTRAFARFVSLLKTGRRITILVAPNPFSNHESMARLAMLLYAQATTIIPLGAQVNSCGAICMAGLSSSGAAANADTLIEAVEAGRIRALYLLGEDPLETLPDPVRVRTALEKLDLIICQSPFRTAITDLAHVVLPSALLPEKNGSVCSLLNREIEIHSIVAPMEESRSDMDIFRELAALITPTAISGAPSDPFWQQPRDKRQDLFEATSEALPFRLIAVPSLFGDTLLVRQSPDLSALRREIGLVMNSRDFEDLQLAEREIVHIQTLFGSARAEAQRDAVIPRGTILLRHVTGCAEGLSLIRRGQMSTPAAVTRITL